MKKSKLIIIGGLANMKILKKMTNGVLLILIGILHTRLGVSADGLGRQFWKFSESGFFQVSRGMDEMPAMAGKTNFENFATFWFFYFGILLIPLGLLVHSIEKEGRKLPHYFTISYLVFVLIGSFMIPKSGMTIIMLPHALYMLVRNYMPGTREPVR